LAPAAASGRALTLHRSDARAAGRARLTRAEDQPMPRPSDDKPPRHRSLVLLAVCGVLALAACGERKDRPPSQAAARVNGDEIPVQLVQQVLQQQRGLRPEQVDAAGRQVVERLIDQQLALQKAEELKLERDLRVAQQVEAARREVLARAYAERVGDAAIKPTEEEVRKYYDEKPALFRQRRIYNLQELAIEARPDQVGMLREQLAAARNLNEFVETLKANDFRFGATQAVRPAEQLPLASLDAIARLADGQAMVTPTPTGVQVLFLAGSRDQPLTLDQARPAIEQFILNDRRRKLVEEDLKSLRAAAKIEYLGSFAAVSASPASAPAAAGGGAPAVSEPAR
jgi:EpsD family peptidyl-prolyl cis-trans isomerase